MNIRELRLGNRLYDGSGKEIIVDRIDADDTIHWDFPDAKDEDEYMEGHIDDVLPIPITEDRLKKFGFKMDGEIQHIWDSPNPKYRMYGWAWNLQMFSNNRWVDVTTKEHPTKYIHKLQNLYFELTGQELETSK